MSNVYLNICKTLRRLKKSPKWSTFAHGSFYVGQNSLSARAKLITKLLHFIELSIVRLTIGIVIFTIYRQVGRFRCKQQKRRSFPGFIASRALSYTLSSQRTLQSSVSLKNFHTSLALTKFNNFLSFRSWRTTVKNIDAQRLKTEEVQLRGRLIRMKINSS